MDLTFNKDGEFYVSEFEVTADFALHIERSDVGTIQLFQNTGSSHGYAIVEDFRFDNRNKLVIDYDTPVLIPKRIRIESEVEPTYCSIVSSGEITEIKSQAKSIEITSNGTTSVEPDAGFSYLSKVDVKTNVAQSGGSGGGASGIEDIYLDASAISDSDYNMLISAYKRRLDSNGAIFFVPRGLGSNPYLAGEDIACVIMSNTPFTNLATGEYSTAGESMLEQEASGKVLPRITKEEFYNLDTPNTPS